MKTRFSIDKRYRAARLWPPRFVLTLSRSIAAVGLICLFSFFAAAQNKYDKLPIGKIEIDLGGTEKNVQVIEQYRLVARVTLGDSYSSTRIRDAIAALYATKKVDTVTVAAALDPAGKVDLFFNVKRKTQAGKISIVVGPAFGDAVTEQELLIKLNLLTPGTAVTDAILSENADQILDYLRDRGFYRSQVVHERYPLQSENEVGVTFKVTPGDQARIDSFAVNVEGFKKPIPPNTLKLKKGSLFSQERLQADITKFRELLYKDGFLAPDLPEPDVRYDGDNNSISVAILGKVGPAVSVVVDTTEKKIGSGLQTKLLPVKREGTLDYAAIIEGERRLENYYQEQGYFFVDATSVCSVTPQIADSENNLIANGTEFLCQQLGTEDLMGRAVEVRYRVVPNRLLTLTRLYLKGTDKLTIEDVRTVLSSREANILGVIPVLGYGRGYTSAAILEDDRNTIKSMMAELGYRDATVHANQGVAPNGEDLMITFVVEEGLPSVIGNITISGNKAIGTTELLGQLHGLTGSNYSRARERNAVTKLREYYFSLGYYDAHVTSEMSEKPAGEKKRDISLALKITDEGRTVVINRILVNGSENTKDEAVLRALTMKSGDLLRSTDIYTSEQNLYGTDAFSNVRITTRPAGDGPGGTRLADVIVNLEEQPPRLMSYGGGYSTDFGLSGFFDIRHVNLFGSLWQGGSRVKMSQRQQLVQFDFINPRFLRDGEKRWAPLTFSVQYQRDSTVTRFFRSAFDQGTFGIVQRVDADGNPIDDYGYPAGDPTINRFAVSAETNRTISRKNRSLFFFRYRFEDVRLFNIESLLIKELLRPDERVRISGFGVTFVRDTRRNCSVKYSLLDMIAKGEPAEPCQYNASDPTNGSYITADYNISLRALGANIGFQKFQVGYNYYYTIKPLKKTTLAARGIIGAGNVLSGGDRFNSAQYPALNGLLPISERFFGGGSVTLRGFNFEEAGPRVVIVPDGIYYNSKGEPVHLDPFTIPFGGNGLAVVNIEARIPLSNTLRAVPFYDAGNVFRRGSDIFRKPDVSASNIQEFNQIAFWSHTVGLGLRIKTPIGGEFAVDYGHLINPPRFIIPQSAGPPAFYRLGQDHVHFRFSQAF